MSPGLSYSSQDKGREGLLHVSQPTPNADAELSAASFQTLTPCWLPCSFATMPDTSCKAEHLEVMRIKLMPYVSDQPRHHWVVQSKRDTYNGAEDI